MVFFNGFKFNKWQNLIYKDQNYFSNISDLKNKMNIPTIMINVAHDVPTSVTWLRPKNVLGWENLQNLWYRGGWGWLPSPFNSL
jgi:hypothetical protein